MDVKDLIARVSQREPLNPYQIAGMTAVIDYSGVETQDRTELQLEDPADVLMTLDRTGSKAARFLVDARGVDSTIVLFPKFNRESLRQMTSMTSMEGRRQAIEENLIPALCEIPNWLDVVKTLTRYSLERDEEALGDSRTRVMDMTMGFLCAAVCQPFDAEASAQAEYSICRIVEGILKSTPEDVCLDYLPLLRSALEFQLAEVFPTSINPFERRIIEVMGVRSAMKRCPQTVKDSLAPCLDKMSAQALQTALKSIPPCPEDRIRKLADAVEQEDFPDKERFKDQILARIQRHSPEEIERLRARCQAIVDGRIEPDADETRKGIEFVKSVGDEWERILAEFKQVVETVPGRVQAAFAEVLAVQILNIAKPELKKLLVAGLCDIVLSLEKTRKQASRELVNLFTGLFLDRAAASDNPDEVISCIQAVESLGISLGRKGYYLMAQELINQLTARPLIHPPQAKFTIEDDDTGEPLVVAEEAGANRAHVADIKGLMAIIASNPRIMHKLAPYLVVELDFGGARICDEDLIQYWISSLLRANSSITHFLIRTLIKVLPYSFKDIGPLDNLRLTAAGLAKELANRGVKPIGNFLGKLRGDIHWRGSIENFYFCQGIFKYLATSDPEAMREWMPPESMPYLGMDQWCSKEEARGCRELCEKILQDNSIQDLGPDSLIKLVGADTARYRDLDSWPELSKRVVLDTIDMLGGLHAKYFVVARSERGSTAESDLKRLEQVLDERLSIKEDYLTPDLSDPLPEPVTLIEGSDDFVREMERIRKDAAATPFVLRAKKAGHAYAQKASYIEERFEAFNKDLKLEALQETIASSINNTHFDSVTPENFTLALVFLNCLVKGVSVNGHSSYYLLETGKDLYLAKELGLTFDKVGDLIRILKKELDDIHSLYRSWFEPPVDRFLSDGALDNIPRKLRNLTTLKEIPETDFFRNYLKTLYISDLEARDGNLRVLETFVEKVELFLNQRLADSGRKVFESDDRCEGPSPFYFPDQGEVSACRIGLKAALLRFAENTPGYFVITADQRLTTPEEMFHDDGFREGLKAAVRKLESQSGRGFGDTSNPLLCSVRSGARISMPGMMITITNVGINDDIAARLAEQVTPWFAYDSYRRFLQEFGQSVFGVGREEFQDIIDERKLRWRVARKAEFSGDQMRVLAFDYKERLKQLAPEAVELLDSGRLLDILTRCALEVLHSYDGQAARIYRQAAGIRGNWRTPVTVQTMVYGNRDFETSGTGVVSYDPRTLELAGVFSRGDQGTDVVDGKVNTITVYDLWKKEESLASHLPESWRQLSSMVYRSAERLHIEVNVEYTIEQGNVHILQIRKHREIKERLPSLKAQGYRVIAQGAGVSGRIFRGIMVTDRNQIAPFRHINKAQSIINAMNQRLDEGEKLDGFVFVVNDPIPEEIMEEVFSLPVSTALISRLGGRGAHAADVAKSLERVYVGQVRDIVKFAGKPESVKFQDRRLVVGSKIIVHGQTGEIALYGKRSER